MRDTFIPEGIAARTSTEGVGPGDLVALYGDVYRILSYQGDDEPFVDAENIEKFERVPLTTAIVLSCPPLHTLAKKRHRTRKGQ